MELHLSPNFKHDKLDSPNFQDLVDVFEDTWEHCIFAPVQLMLKTPHGDIAAMMILSTYFEVIQICSTGQDSIGKSQAFFVNGFCRVFKSDSHGLEEAAKAIYKYIRCGLTHEGMLSHKVNYSRLGAKPFFLTYPKKDGNLDLNAGVTSIVINPQTFYIAIKNHFDGYVSVLRAERDKEIMDAFEVTFKRLWGLGTGENIVGMTEHEFLAK
ncbi:hypothetical protein [Methylotenera sp.]|uniref:hypothetical protein n=1 Tax=Methylotenera sp. TaxID=2051956 RepID=UPI0024883E2A|nr:hypothetical protein [Methylotenera sp.]MDI1297612.1 hypothetical protein [Methylotenera sp.]